MNSKNQDMEEKNNSSAKNTKQQTSKNKKQEAMEQDSNKLEMPPETDIVEAEDNRQEEQNTTKQETTNYGLDKVLDILSIIYSSKLFVFVITFAFIIFMGIYSFKKNDLTFEKIKDYFNKSRLKEKNIDELVSDKDAVMVKDIRTEPIKQVAPDETAPAEDPILKKANSTSYVIKRLLSEIAAKKKAKTFVYNRNIKKGDFVLLEFDFTNIMSKIQEGGQDNKLPPLPTKNTNIVLVNEKYINENFVKLLLQKKIDEKFIVYAKDVLSKEKYDILLDAQKSARENMIKTMKDRTDQGFDEKTLDDMISINKVSYSVKVIDILTRATVKKYDIENILLNNENEE